MNAERQQQQLQQNGVAEGAQQNSEQKRTKNGIVKVEPVETEQSDRQKD